MWTTSVVAALDEVHEPGIVMSCDACRCTLVRAPHLMQVDWELPQHQHSSLAPRAAPQIPQVLLAISIPIVYEATNTMSR